MAHMDAENKALAYVVRHPLAEWAVKLVKKPDGSRPETSTVRL